MGGRIIESKGKEGAKHKNKGAKMSDFIWLGLIILVLVLVGLMLAALF